MHTIFIKFSFKKTFRWHNIHLTKEIKNSLAQFLFLQIDFSLLTPNELILTIIFLSKIEERWKIWVSFYRNPFMDKKFDCYR